MPYIREDCVRRVKEATDIVTLIESYGHTLKRVGSNFTTLCPFHEEKTPSFNINPAMQIFKCFGCDAKGDVFKFMQLMERCEFGEAVEMLAERAGVQLEYDRSRGGVGRSAEDAGEARRAHYWANRVACEYFEERLHDPREGARARTYLLERGFSEETIARWRLGWAPDCWDGLLERYVRVVLEKSGEHKKEKALEVGGAAGIFRKNEDGRVYDAFRGRVMFPIFDSRAHVVGFGGRILEEAENQPKYLNSAGNSRFFEKRRLLYGLNFAEKDIRREKTVIIVEGYTDTIMCHQYGIRTAVATLGTSLTDEHVARLRNYVKPEGRVVALFDTDNAGRMATDRAIEMFMAADVPLRIVQGLEVKDACDYLPRFGVERFREVLDRAEDSFDYALRQALPAETARDANTLAAAVNRVMGLVNCCPDRVKRALLRKQVAAVADVPGSSLPQPEVDASGNIRLPGMGARSDASPVARRGLQPKGPNASKAEARRRNRLKRERLLVRYMLARSDWAEVAADCFPPERMLDETCARLAGRIRDSWLAHERPAPSALLDVPGADEVLVDDLMGDEGPELEQAEFHEVLHGLEVAELLEEKAELDEEIRRLRVAGEAERLDELMVRKTEIERRMRGLGGESAA